MRQTEQGVERELAGREPLAEERALWERALVVAQSAYAPYSGFRVGAIIRGSEGREATGVNVESAASPAGLCAERAALGAYVTAGGRDVVAVAVASPSGDAAPCGVCLQALSEFGDPLIVAQVAGEVRVFRLTELLRVPFRRSATAEP